MLPFAGSFCFNYFKYLHVGLFLLILHLPVLSQTPTYTENFEGTTADLDRAPWTIAGWGTTVDGTNMGTGTATIVDDPTEAGNRVMKADKKVPPPGESYDVNSSKEEIKYLSKASSISGAPVAFPPWFTPISYRWRFYFTGDHDWDNVENGNFGVASWHHSTQVGISGGAPANFRVVGNDLKFKARWASPANPTDNDVKESSYTVWSNMKKNTWYYIVVDITWDYREGKTGQIKAYMKEGGWPSSPDLVMDHSGSGKATGFNWDLTNWFQVGLYAWRWRTPTGADQSRQAGVEKFEFYIDDFQYTQGEHSFSGNSGNSNQSPNADAGQSKTITLPNNRVTLNGSGSDPNGNVVGYQWVQISGPSNATLNQANTADAVASDLKQGTYVFEFTVTDNDGATDSDRMFVTVESSSNQSPTANAGPNQTIVRPANSVWLHGSATDQDGPISSYHWTQQEGPSAATLTGASNPSVEVKDLVEGSYTFRLTVTDDQGATDTDEVTVTLHAATPTVTPSITDASCSAKDGAISLTLNGGQGPFIFNWSNGATTKDIAGIAAGNYQVTITDRNGTSISESFRVNSTNSKLIITAEIDHTSCSQAEGAINVTVSGGTKPYSFTWSSGEKTSSINRLSGGTYSLLVIDDNGCQKEASFEVPIEPGEAKFEINAKVTNASCSGNDGSISLGVLGEQGPYTFLWTNGVTTPNLTGLGIGGYQVTITDRHGCYMKEVFIVDQNSIADPVITQSGDSLFIEQHATYYQWYKDGIVLEGSTQNYLKVSEPGSYMVQIADDNCTNISAPHIIEDVIGFTASNFYTIRQVDIFPNPVENQLNARIYLNERAHASITIYGFQGEPLLTQDLGIVASVHTSTLNLDSLPPGLYFIKIAAGQEVLTRKFVKQ